MWCITLIDLWILKNPCISGIKPTWSWCMIFLTCCWILFARIFPSTVGPLSILSCSLSAKRKGVSIKIHTFGDFQGSPVVRTLTARLGSIPGRGPKIPPTTQWDKKIKMYTSLCSISFLGSQPSALHFITGEIGAREMLLQGKVSETASLPLYL